MSWTALLLAGVVLGQASPLPTRAAEIPPASLQPRGEPAAAASGAQQPAGAYGGLPGNETGSGFAPLPGDWRASETPGAGAPTAAAPASQPAAAPSGPSNIWERFNYLEQLREEKSASQGAAVPPAQPPAATPPPSNLAEPGYGARANAPVATPRNTVPLPATARLTPKEMLDEAMTLPAGTAVAGRAVTLLDVLGQITERSKRIEIAHAYWQLAMELGQYRYCWEESQQIQSIGLATIDSKLLASAQQAIDRELTAAELALLQAQYSLAEVAGLDSSAELPLPGDRPHLGTYNTHFEQIFAELTPPAQTRLLHQTLPLQHQVIGVRAEAVHAAQEAFQAIARSYQAGQVDAADLLASLHEITNQRRAWIAAVTRYNHSIANYALAVAGPETTGRALVEILIKLAHVEPSGDIDKQADDSTGFELNLAQQVNAESSQETPAKPEAAARPGVPTLAPARERLAEDFESQAVPPVPVDPVEAVDLAVEPASVKVPVMEEGEPATDSAVQPAVADASLPDSTVRDEMRPGEQDLAEPAVVDHEGLSEEPAAATRTAETVPPSAPGATETPMEVAADPVAQHAVAQADASNEAEPPARGSRNLAIQTSPMVTVEESEAMPRVQTVFRQPSDGLGLPRANLVGLSPGVQAKRLTVALHGGAKAVRPDATVVDLEACLDGVVGGKRRGVIEAYWEASLGLAECEVYRKRLEMLDELVESVTLGAAGTVDARARLKAARLDAEADLLEAESRLLATQHELTRRCGRPLDQPWLLPETLPHVGDYRLHLESQPPQVVASWSLKRLAAIIPALNRSLKTRAAAVVEADARRAETVTAYQAQTLRFDRVLAAVDQQTQECLEFLNVVAAYNQSIADYVTTVVPEALPEDQLVATLVVR